VKVVTTDCSHGTAFISIIHFDLFVCAITSFGVLRPLPLILKISQAMKCFPNKLLSVYALSSLFVGGVKHFTEGYLSAAILCVDF